ncbi:type II secretion system protein [Candidatus Saccharibacteria bacterium]|nr:type II secretion system protein [Candidatus Saccharibacteria bacterium]
MAKENIKNKKGFTIIEVVLVLAIAGLIFLMVFIALPALQRSQRDTQRRSDLGRAIAAVQSYQANNNGSIPDFKATFISGYLKAGGDSFQDPSGKAYVFSSKNDSDAAGVADCLNTGGSAQAEGTACALQASTTFAAGRIVAIKNATCKGEKAIRANGANRVALVMKLEGAGTTCYSN